MRCGSASYRLDKNDACKNSCYFCMSRSAFGGLGIYPKLVEFAGAGATIPLTGFGNSLAQGVKEAVQKDGLIGGYRRFYGLCRGRYGCMLSGLIVAVIAKPKDK